jgi:hypothetical protein
LEQLSSLYLVRKGPQIHESCQQRPQSSKLLKIRRATLSVGILKVNLASFAVGACLR